MLGLATLIAFCVAAGAGVLDCVSSHPQSYRRSYSYGPIRTEKASDRTPQYISTVVATVVAFLLMMLFNWLSFYETWVTFAGFGWFPLAITDLLIVLVVFGIANGATGRVGGAAVMMVVALVGLLIFTIATGIPVGVGRDAYGKIAKVDIHHDVTSYPPTDDNHMVIVSQQNALYKANQAMGQDLPGSNTTIGSKFKLGDCTLQSVDVHMYWICALKFTGNHNGYVLPGYIAVDGEDPLTEPQAHLNYKLTYSQSAPQGHSLTRLIWNKYNDYYVDDVTLEVNDQWQPFYTAALERPLVRNQQAVPVAAIVVNPQTGNITRYDLNHIPTWVDRIYSASMAKNILNWWGEWGVKSWHKQGTAGRYEVDGNVDLVYTTSGPAWQALMSSQNNDSSVNYIALMNTRSTHVDMYEATDVTIQQTVINDVEHTKNTNKVYDPAGMAIHKIYGELTWVMPLVPQGTDSNTPESFAGLALLRANDPNSADVIVGSTKGDALSQYAVQLATGDNNNAPGSESHVQSKQGTIARASQITNGGSSYEIITLMGDSSDIFQGQIQSDDYSSLEMSLAKPGDNVTLTYAKNTGNKVKVITSYTLNSTH